MITNFDELLCNAEQILSKRSLSPVTIDQYLAGMRQIFKIARALGHQSCLRNIESVGSILINRGQRVNEK